MSQPSAPSRNAAGKKTEATILFQKYFKSRGPRTYAVQVKQASNGNHFCVFTEGKRDAKTDELRKTMLFVFSEDFDEFFALADRARQFIREHPVPQDVKRKREKFWAKKSAAR